jgi:hypothetical protein
MPDARYLVELVRLKPLEHRRIKKRGSADRGAKRREERFLAPVHSGTYTLGPVASAGSGRRIGDVGEPVERRGARIKRTPLEEQHRSPAFGEPPAYKATCQSGAVHGHIPHLVDNHRDHRLHPAAVSTPAAKGPAARPTATGETCIDRRLPANGSTFDFTPAVG